MFNIASVDIGGTKIAVAAVREDGTILKRLEAPTDAEKGFQQAIDRTSVMLREFTSEGIAFAGIGVGCPGPLDPFTGIIGDVGTLPGWQGGNLIAALEAEFHLSVSVENDADAAALGEGRWGSDAQNGRFLYVTISTGIGGGFLINGQLYRGVEGAHPELGHQVLDWSGPLCYCGARGCWEALASGPGMVAWMQQEYPHSNFTTAAEICAAAEKGDAPALRCMEREGFYLGLGLANLITLFTPETIALGGGVMKSSALFMDQVRKVIRQICTQVPAEKTRLTMASLGADAGLLGAAQAWVLRHGSQNV